MKIRTTFVIETAVPLTHYLPKTEAEKITKCDNCALEIKNIWKLNNASAYPLVISAEGVVTENLLKHLENTGLTENILRVWRGAVHVRTCHTVRKVLVHPLDLTDRVKFIPLSEPNPTDGLE